MEDFPFPAFHERYYSKFCVPAVKNIPGNALTLLFHSNGIALLSIDKTHVAHKLIENPPRLSSIDPASAKHIDVQKSEKSCAELPYGYTLTLSLRDKDGTSTRCECYRYEENRKLSCLSPEMHNQLSISKEPVMPAADPKVKKPKKFTMQAETGLGTLVLTFYYESEDFDEKSTVQYTFPIVPCVPCEIVELNSLFFSESVPHFAEDGCLRLTLESPYNVGFLCVLNPSWKFRADVLPILIEIANPKRDPFAEPLSDRLKVGSREGLSSVYSAWEVVAGKMESDIDAAIDMKGEVG